MQRIAIAALVGLVLVPGTSRGDGLATVRAIERHAGRLSRTGLDRELVAVDQGRVSVWIRPVARVIGVAGPGLRQRGFFLDHNRRLSSTDRAELAQLLDREAGKATPSSVLRSLNAELGRHRRAQQALRTVDPVIDGALQRAAAAGPQETSLWRGRRHAELTIRPGHDVLVGYRGLSSQGFPLQRGPAGLSVVPEYRDALRQFLLDNR